MNLVRRRNQGRPTGRDWTPRSELERFYNELDRFFDMDLWESAPGLFDRSFAPALDVIEEDDAFVVNADLPGVSEKDVDVSVASNVLTIKGEKKNELENKEDQVFRRESWHGSFQRTLSLPATVDVDKVEAKLRDGVLTVRVPKREEAQPRQISVKVK